MDPSVLLKQRGVRWDDPLDDYTKLRSLRDLMDQRRFREQQYLLQQQAMQEHARKAQWEMEDRQRAMNLSDLLTKNPEAPFPEVAKVGGLGPALKIEQERLARQNAQRLAEKSGLDVQGERAKREANLYAAVLQLPPEQRQDYWEKNVGGGIPIDLPPTAADEQAQYALAYGGEAAEKRQEERRKAASAKRTEPYVEQEIIDKAEMGRSKRVGVKLFNSSNQDEWDRLVQELPEAERGKWIGTPFNHQNRYKALTLGQTPTEILTQERLAVPDNLDKVTQALNNPDTPREQIPYLEATRKQMIENRIETRPPVAGGIDIPGLIEAIRKDPSRYAELSGETKAKILPGLTAAGVTGLGKSPITPAIKGQAQGLKDLENAVNEYRAELDRVGPTFRPGKGAKLNTLYTNLMMKVKGPEMYALGVLAGPDMAVLSNALSPPDSAKANFALGTSGLRDQLSVFDALVASKRGVLKEMYGIGEEEPKPPPANTQPTAQPQKTAPSPLLKPGSVIVRTPDGAFTFSSQAEADAFKKKAGL